MNAICKMHVAHIRRVPRNVTEPDFKYILKTRNVILSVTRTYHVTHNVWCIAKCHIALSSTPSIISYALMSRVISYHTGRHANAPSSIIHRARPYIWLDHTHWCHSLISHRKIPQLTCLDHTSGSIGNHTSVLCRLPHAEYRISRTGVTRNIISHRRTRRHTCLDHTSGSIGRHTSV